FQVSPVSSFMTVIGQPGIAAPLESVTIPVMVAVVWALAGTTKLQINKKAKTTRCCSANIFPPPHLRAIDGGPLLRLLNLAQSPRMSESVSLSGTLIRQSSQR